MRTLLLLTLSILFVSLQAQESKLSKPDSLHQVALKFQAENNHVKAVYNFIRESEFYLINNELNRALEVIDKVIQNYPEGADSLFSRYSQMLRLRAFAYAYQDKTYESAKGFERQLNHLLSYPSDSIALAGAYRNTAQAYFNLQDPKGIQYINKAIEINKSLNNTVNIIDNYLALVSYLSNLGLSEMANRYLDHCELLFESEQLEDYGLLAYIYKKKGINYTNSKEYEKSLFWVKKAYQTMLDNEIKTKDIANSAGNVALEAKNNKDYKLAKVYARKTLKYADEYYAPNSSMHATAYLVLGEIFALDKQNDSADYYLDKSIAIYIQLLGPNYFYLSIPYHQKAIVQENKGHHLEAVEYYQKSLYSNFGISEKMDTTLLNSPNLDDSYFSFDALKYATLQKTTQMYAVFKENGKQEYLDACISHISKLDSLEWEFTNRKTMSLEENIIQFKEFEEALALIARIAVENQNSDYVRQGFQMLNNQKAGYLDASIFQNKELLLDDSGTQLETELASVQEKIVKYEKNYKQLSKLSFEEKTSVLNQLSELHLNKLELKNQINKVAADKGESFTINNIDIEKAKQLAKMANASVLDYFYYKNKLYIYLINEHGLKLKEVEIDDNFEYLIQSFNRAIKTQSNERDKIGQTLSSLILIPVLSEINNTQKLIIIPFGGLSEIPFDLLPTTKDGRIAVQDFAISYHYSTKLWMHSWQNSQSKTLDLLAIAPVFKKKDDIQLTDYEDFALDTLINQEFVYRSGNLKPLPHSIKEINSLERIFSSRDLNITTLTYSAANVDDFLKHVKSSQIIHIATHGIASKSNPYKTGLFFYIPEGDNKEDHFLSVYDLSSIQLDADLVVLSACKTGSGQLAKGEGVIALPRALINSGAQNVMASLWKVHDAKTKFLMTAFYTYLADGDDYAIALQKAKLDCIKKGYLAIDWAGFIIIGR